MYILLEIIIDEQESNAQSEEKRILIAQIIVFFYFRIAPFREKLLSIMANDRISAEISSTDQSINLILFNWGKEFFQRIQ